jgi:hypothetical protein
MRSSRLLMGFDAYNIHVAFEMAQLVDMERFVEHILSSKEYCEIVSSSRTFE